MLLALARLACSRLPLLGLLEGEAADSVKTTFTFLASLLKPLLPRLGVDGEDAGVFRDDETCETLGCSPDAHQAGTSTKPLPLWGQT